MTRVSCRNSHLNFSACNTVSLLAKNSFKIKKQAAKHVKEVSQLSQIVAIVAQEIVNN